MRVCLMRICTLALSVAAPSTTQAQRMVTTVGPTNAADLRVASFGSLAAPTTVTGVALHALLVQAKSAPSAVAQADSLIANDTHPPTGPLVAGFPGPVDVGLPF